MGVQGERGREHIRLRVLLQLTWWARRVDNAEFPVVDCDVGRNSNQGILYCVIGIRIERDPFGDESCTCDTWVCVSSKAFDQ